MSYRIRLTQRGDVDQLVELCAAHARYEQCHYSVQGKKEALEEALFSACSGLNSLVVVVGKELVGYTTFIKQFSTWDAAYYLYLDCLYLKEEYRGVGIGKRLLDGVKQKAQELNCYQIQWQTPIENKKAIKFYLREGANCKNKSRFYFDLG